MSLYSRHVLPHLICAACSSATVMAQREKVVPLAEGRVLEIGIGGGLNLPYYDRGKVSHLFGLDISAELMAGARRRSDKIGLPFEGLLLDAAEIPLESRSVDTVLVTYTMCSIDALDQALAEMRRVLATNGRLIFCEHTAAPDQNIHRWQQRITPVWRRIGGGCRLDRHTPDAIRDAGFDLTSLSEGYLPGTPRFVGHNSWGIACPR